MYILGRWRCLRDRPASNGFDKSHQAPLPVLYLARAQRADALVGPHPRLPARSGPPAPTQKCFGGVGFGSAGTRCGSRSRGLDVAQILLVAIRKYLAVVARLRWPSSS